MRILQVCKKFPYPVMDGEAVAVRALALGLREAGCEVDLLSFNTSKHRVTDMGEVDLPHYRHIASSELDNDVVWWRVATSLLRRGSYHVTRFECDRFRVTLEGLLREHDYDAIVLETSILATYIPVIREVTDAAVLLRAHNVEHEIWDRLGRRGNRLQRPVYRELARRLRKFERAYLPKADVLCPITARDAEAFRRDLGYRGPVHVVPVGYDPDARLGEVLEAKPTTTFAMSFIGSLDWAPNLEGLDWFLQSIWPKLHRAFPDLQFHVAGRKTPPRILSLDLPNVFVHGEVPDSRAFLRDYPMTVAPILSGSGTRVKILDAMSAGRVVLTTSMGLEGIDAVDREHVLVCDDARTFVTQLNWLRGEGERGGKLGRAASALLRERFDYARIGYGLASVIRDRARASTVPQAARS